jgi:S-methylmethionine-dependent homocysteine/selenocysteine methylase
MALAYARLKARLDRGEVVLLDGPLGAEFVRRGGYWRSHGLERNPELLLAIHGAYLEAGADLIRTNTFQLTRRSYLNLFGGPEHMRRIGAPDLDERAGNLVKAAVRLARAAQEQAGHDAVVAGSVSPLEHCFRPDLAPPEAQARAEHRETLRQLAGARVDLIFFECMNRVAEARVALEVANELGLPAWISLACDQGARLLSGEPIGEAVAALAPLEPHAILCDAAPPEDVTVALGELVRRWPGPAGASAMVGRYDPPSWKFSFFPRFTGGEGCPPRQYLAHAARWASLGARVVGGGWGATPAHIEALRDRFPAGRTGSGR